MRARDLTGRTVMDVGDARGLGVVESLVLDPSNHRVVGLRVSGDSPVLRFDDVRSFGPDAVTVEGAHTLHQPSNDVEQRAIENDLDPLGRRVIADDGNVLGELADVDVDDDGTIRKLLVGTAELNGDRLLGVGGYAVVVRA